MTSKSNKASTSKYRNTIPSGIEGLDEIMWGGYSHCRTTLISGASGSGKTLFSLMFAGQGGVGKQAAVFASFDEPVEHLACSTNQKVLYISFEESPALFLRDVRSAGVKLKPHVDSGRCELIGRRPVELGMEEQIILLLRNVREFQPDICIIDPISSLTDLSDQREFKNAVLRLCHALKEAGITTILTELLSDSAGSVSHMNISSIVDTWIRLTRKEEDRTMHRYIAIHKSRGGATSNRVNEFFITGKGIEIELEGKRKTS